MAVSVNKVILLGNIGSDPEFNHTRSGSEICTFSIATTEYWVDKSTGERKEKTEWHRIVVYNPNLIFIAKNHLKKGSKVFIEGTLQTRKWTDSNGVEKSTTEVVLKQFQANIVVCGDNKNQKDVDSSLKSNSSSSDTSSKNPYSTQSDSMTIAIDDYHDDNIPF